MSQQEKYRHLSTWFHHSITVRPEVSPLLVNPAPKQTTKENTLPGFHYSQTTNIGKHTYTHTRTCRRWPNQQQVHRVRGATRAYRKWTSRRYGTQWLTALLPEKYEFEFPQRVSKVAAHGHVWGGGRGGGGRGRRGGGGGGREEVGVDRCGQLGVSTGSGSSWTGAFGRCVSVMGSLYGAAAALPLRNVTLLDSLTHSRP